MQDCEQSDEFNEPRIAFLTSYCAFMSLRARTVSRGRDGITAGTTTTINIKGETS